MSRRKKEKPCEEKIKIVRKRRKAKKIVGGKEVRTTEKGQTKKERKRKIRGKRNLVVRITR